MELWDIYDIDRIKTGETAVRGEKMNPGQYHIVVHVCIFNKKGEMLIQRRCPEKDSWPGYWDITVGGSALQGESTRDAACREVFEELGLVINLDGVRPNLTVNFFPGFDDIYLLEGDVELSSLTLQKEEVMDAKYASKDEILKMIDSGEFIPNMKSFISYIFELSALASVKGAIIKNSEKTDEKDIQ